ncbi:MAG: c-type cytochrome [Pirellulaceae bacterium]|nr:c-type cytochrome [Pirellulaceae bacterium]
MSHSTDPKAGIRNRPHFRQRLWGDVRNHVTDLRHDEDIREFDNPIPAWWKGIFAATVVFSFFYLAFYHGDAEGRSDAERYSVAAANNARLQFAEIGVLVADEPTLVKYANDKNWLAVGKGVFQANCAACHARDGGGKIGPNLTDEQYKNVTKITDIYKVINNGAAAGAMPAWKNRLDQNELVLVSAYAASLRGTSPAVAKSGEGREISAWPAYVEPVETESSDDIADGQVDDESDGETASDSDAADETE